MKVYCDEPEGGMLRTVQQLPPVPIEVEAVWQRLRDVPNFFARMQGDPRITLIQEHWKFWTVDDVGMFWFDPWIRGNAHVHATFWDKRLRGRERLCAVVGLELMRRYKIERLFTTIIPSAHTSIAFAKRIGFVPFRIINNQVVLTATAGEFMMNKSGDKP